MDVCHCLQRIENNALKCINSNFAALGASGYYLLMRIQSRAAQSCQDQEFFSHTGGSAQTALLGESEYHKEMDDAHPELGEHLKSTGHLVCGALSRLTVSID